MMIEPAIEELAKKAGNKYILCNVVSKRAKDIQKSNFKNETYESEIKEITTAAMEIERDELKITVG